MQDHEKKKMKKMRMHDFEIRGFLGLQKRRGVSSASSREGERE